jgi:hypothetical protein
VPDHRRLLRANGLLQQPLLGLQWSFAHLSH